MNGELLNIIYQFYQGLFNIKVPYSNINLTLAGLFDAFYNYKELGYNSFYFALGDYFELYEAEPFYQIIAVILTFITFIFLIVLLFKLFKWIFNLIFKLFRLN